MDEEVLEEVVTFGECPNCGLPCQHLPEGPQGYPWHDCDWVLSLKARASGGAADGSATMDGMMSAIFGTVIDRARELPSRDLASILEGTAAVLKAKGSSDGGTDQKLLDFLRNRIDEEDGLEELFDETQAADRDAVGKKRHLHPTDQPGS